MIRDPCVSKARCPRHGYLYVTGVHLSVMNQLWRMHTLVPQDMEPPAIPTRKSSRSGRLKSKWGNESLKWPKTRQRKGEFLWICCFWGDQWMDSSNIYLLYLYKQLEIGPTKSRWQPDIFHRGVASRKAEKRHRYSRAVLTMFLCSWNHRISDVDKDRYVSSIPPHSPRTGVLHKCHSRPKDRYKML